MIVRINQFDPANAEPYSGWGEEGLRGAIQYEWPEDTHAFEVLILESDERQRQLAPAFRQSQLRRLVPEILSALAEPGEQIIARLDGPMIPSELVAAMKHMVDAQGQGRFAVSSAQRLRSDGPAPIGSVRLHLSIPRLAALCMNANGALDAGVRLRLFVVPDSLVSTLLEVSDLNDPRWAQALANTGLVAGTMRGMQSIYLLSRRLNPTEARQRILKRLLGQPEMRAV